MNADILILYNQLFINKYLPVQNEKFYILGIEYSNHTDILHLYNYYQLFQEAKR